MDLIVWQKAHRLVLKIYQASSGFPKEETYCLASQMRRAAASVPTNIAEGFSRATAKHKLHFYNMAQSSLEELKYCIILSRDLNYLTNVAHYWQSAEEVGVILVHYIKGLKNNL